MSNQVQAQLAAKKSIENIKNEEPFPREKLVLPTINTGRKLQLFDAQYFTNLQISSNEEALDNGHSTYRKNTLHQRQSRAIQHQD